MYKHKQTMYVVVFYSVHCQIIMLLFTAMCFASRLSKYNCFIISYHDNGLFCMYYIDNHDSGYLGMAVQLYVQAHLGHYHILTQKKKLMAQLKFTPLFTYNYMHNLNF